jgi:hypothetical protein
LFSSSKDSSSPSELLDSGIPSYFRKETSELEGKISDFDLGWIVGIIDGEGSIGLHKVRRKSVYSRRGFQWDTQVDVSNTSKAIVQRFCDILGVCKLVLKRKRGNRKPVWGMYINRDKMRTLLYLVKDHLTDKKEQAELLLETLELLHLLQKKRDSKLFNIIQTRLDTIHFELGKLNARGLKSHPNKDYDKPQRIYTREECSRDLEKRLTEIEHGAYEPRHYSWSDKELETLKANLSLPVKEQMKLLPQKTFHATKHMRRKLKKLNSVGV